MFSRKLFEFDWFSKRKIYSIPIRFINTFVFPYITTVVNLSVALEGYVVKLAQALDEQEQRFRPIPAVNQHAIKKNMGQATVFSS